MKTFLRVVAEEYFKKYKSFKSITFVVPNKRSEIFLLKEISLLHDKAVLAPRILPITDFVSEISELVTDSRIDSLFRLYKCFCKIKEGKETMPFEKFCSIGETILSDFNEIDLQMASPDEIFKNIYDFNSLRSRFLTDAHKKVLVTYFGYPPEYFTDDINNRLWVKFEDFTKTLTDDKSKLKRKFHSLWSVLAPLYESFSESLSKDGLATSGGTYRKAVERLEEGFEPYPGEKIVFVGFNALSESETRIFRALKKMKVDLGGGAEDKADFIWDKVYPFFGTPGEDPASKYISLFSDSEQFPTPEHIEEALEKSYGESLSDIEVVAVPSNIMQAKIAGMELGKWADGLDEKELKDPGIAVILPEETMLVPLLYSLPGKFSHPNLTMGFPLKQTPVTGFSSLLRKLHQNAGRAGLSDAFFFSDVKDFLCHPYSHILFPVDVSTKFIRRNEKKRKLVVTTKELETLGDEALSVFKMLNRSSAGEVLEYILAVFRRIRDRIDDSADSYLRSHIEKVYVATYIDAVIRLSHSVAEYRFELTPEDIFMLADKLLGGESVVFKGEPLEGLQVMGVLETRCLDFKKIIILSMNEKIMPRIGRNSTFIPNIIRMGFGLPPANYQQEIFAYYFFRLLGRCEKAFLTYDSRSSDNKSPGISRYILQMKYLAPKIRLKEIEASFALPKELNENIEIVKDSYIQQKLEEYYLGDSEKEESGKRNFSASALKDYFSCPVKFLCKDVLKLPVEKEELESLDTAEVGSIVHKSIERLYFPEGKRGRLLEEPILLTEEELDALLDEDNSKGETRIEREARRAILETHYGKDEEQSKNGKLEGSSVVILEFIVEYIKMIIRGDKKKVPFRLWGSEIERTVKYVLSDKKEIQFKMIIDRMDQEGNSDNNAPFRVVDYKTGKSHLKAEHYGKIFDGSSEASNVLQLLLYSELLIKSVDEGLIKLPSWIDKERFKANLEMVIYEIPNLDKNGMVAPQIEKYIDSRGTEKSRRIKNMAEFRQLEGEIERNFMKDLEKHLEEILDPGRPFKGSLNEDSCKYCDYILHCKAWRAWKENEK